MITTQEVGGIDNMTASSFRYEFVCPFMAKLKENNFSQEETIYHTYKYIMTNITAKELESMGFKNGDDLIHALCFYYIQIEKQEVQP